jgi:uncharacterized iron-regulated membrane protein
LRRLGQIAHRYLGLVAGLPLVIIGLSGSLLALRDVVDAALNPALNAASQNPAEALPRDLDALVALARARVPAKAQARSIDFATPERPVIAVHFEQTLPDAEQWYEVVFDAATAALRGVRPTWGSTRFERATFAYAVYELHVALFCGHAGTNLVGCLGVCLCLVLVTGLQRAWPRSGALSKLFRRVRTDNPARSNYELHRLAGAYGALVLMMLGCTGAYFIFPELFLTPLRPISRLTPPPTARTPVGPRRITLAQALERSAALRGTRPLLSVSLPRPDDHVYVVHWQAHGPGASRCSIDAGTGELIPHAAPHGFADAFDAWQFPLHSGRALGWPGRLLVGVAGLLPLALWITGCRHLRRSARARAAARALHAARGRASITLNS